MPERIDGLPREVIDQLPAEVVNVVPERTLATASFQCPTTGAGAGSGGGTSGPLTRALEMLSTTGMVAGAALPLGLGLLALGVMLHRHGARRQEV
jgi:hypothetical protein